MNSIKVSNVAKAAIGTFVLAAASLAIPAIPVLASAPNKKQIQHMRVCKYAVGTRMFHLPMSQIQVEAPSADERGNSMINWRTTKGEIGYCRIDSRGVVIEFKMENNSSIPTAERESNSLNPQEN